jgi:RNA polymerase sigma-70 factor (ECF subfamily)
MSEHIEEVSREEVAEVYRQHGYLLQERCRRILRDPGLAEDALQQTFIRLLRYGKSYRESPSRLFWLLRACNQVCFNMLKKRKRIHQVEGTAYENGISAGPADGSSPAPIRLYEEWQVVDQFLHKLDAKEREIAVYHYLDGMTQVEIARLTGWSRPTVIKKLKSIQKRAQRFREAVNAV